MRRILIGLSVLCLLTTQTTALAQSHGEGLSAGREANATIQRLLNDANARDVVPDYTASPPQTGYYGQRSLAEPARAHLLACARTPSDPLCQAQQGAVASAQLPGEPLTPGDPAIDAAQGIAEHPGQVLTLSGYYADCQGGLPCPGNVYCLGEHCYPTHAPQDADFARSMTLLEAAREAGVYIDPHTVQVFQGEANRCRDRLLKNCCSRSSGGAGMSNQSVFNTGSRLVFDVLMKADNRQFVIQGLKALLMGSGFSGSFTSYGVTLALNGASVPVGSTVLVSGQNFVIAFNPWALAIMVVIYIVLSMMSCNRDEGLLAMKEGANLCVATGNWCSKCIKVFGKCVKCIERSTGKCCFNSRLARLINLQGRSQLGKGWGSGKQPDCSGFSVAQVQQLNFAAMDLREFYSSLVPSLPNVDQLRRQSAGRLNDCYYGQGHCQ